ncbi:MAG: biopolymer transporter ExbD [Bdellovibrio sp.]|nr:biopolymer transporter ExbD [Bdellovibrio sp.]
MRRRTRYKPAVKRNQTFTLNVTSMTDMFTILLVFLLQTYSSSTVELDPVKGLRLPSSNTEKNPVDGIKISISPTELKFDKKTIAAVQNNNIEQAAIDPNDSEFIKPLFDELQKINEAHKLTPDVKIGKVLFQADQDVPYGTLRKIMYTASMAGFPNLKLVTVVGN